MIYHHYLCPSESKDLGQLLYKKNQYNEKVKISDWDRSRETLPFDTDPYDPCNRHDYLSHYKNFGTEQNEPWITTTQAMLEQVHIKPREAHIKKVNNFYVFNDLEPCVTQNYKLNNEEDPWITTMQDSYVNYMKFPMQRLSFPSVPFLKNRKTKISQDGAHLDDYWSEYGKLLNQHKECNQM